MPSAVAPTSLPPSGFLDRRLLAVYDGDDDLPDGKTLVDGKISQKSSPSLFRLLIALQIGRSEYARRIRRRRWKSAYQAACKRSQCFLNYSWTCPRMLSEVCECPGRGGEHLSATLLSAPRGSVDLHANQRLLSHYRSHDLIAGSATYVALIYPSELPRRRSDNHVHRSYLWN